MERPNAPPSSRITSVAPRHDAYADLLHDSRGMRREQQLARDTWMSRLASDRKELIFELEVLLKGLACFANPRNHAGPPRRVPIVAVDFHAPTALLSHGYKRVSQLARACLGERDKAFVFHRYLETIVPEDATRTRLVREDMSQDTPDGSLFALRRSFSNLAEVTDGLLRLPRIPFRLFYATASLAQREVAQNSFFNPLSALEFRPEFDRIASPQVVDLIHRVPGEEAQRLVSLTFLSLFRMLRYLQLLDAIAAEPAEAGAFVPGRLHLVLSVLRSDARALAGYLRTRAGQRLADSFEHDLLRVPASQLRESYDSLLAAGHRLIDVHTALECITASLRLELRRAFEHELPAPAPDVSPTTLREAVRRTVGSLRPTLQNVVLFLAKSFGTTLDEGQVFDDAAARRQISDRLRQHVWMFAQIVRAFAVKARYAQAHDDGWGTVSEFQFVREFLAYFKAMGYPLLRAGDYPRFAAFVDAMHQLEDTDLLEPATLAGAISECEQFYEFLVVLLDQIGRREELDGVEFDKRAAARALKLYLGD